MKENSLLTTIILVLSALLITSGIIFYEKITPSIAPTTTYPSQLTLPKTTSPQPTFPKPQPTEIKNLVETNNQFALDYYQQLRRENEENIFFSPLSISSAFLMTYEGAKGETAKQIQSVFYFPEDSNLRRQEFSSIFKEINKKDKKYQLSIANALWIQKDYPIANDFLTVVQNYYQGKAQNLDFIRDPEDSRVTINNWVENQTNNKIKNLIPQGLIDNLTRLVLTNAIYFKGEWVKQFDKNLTQEEDFTTDEGKIVQVPMMRRLDKEAIFPYWENKDLQILEMPYSGNDLSMLILLPKNNDLSKLEDLLTLKNISEWKKNLEEQQVEVYIPKFKFETKYFMKEDLEKMGMSLPFSDQADFSGITSYELLKIDQAIHQAFIEVNEEGTEAAAATAIGIVATGISPETPKIPVFRVDHPFIFLIQHKNSGAILFIGRVANPNLAS
ncbi:MAG: serpin family protein [Candidatus Paceibacterota bacterium]